METLLRSARDEFPRKKYNSEPNITLGCSNYLNVIMATLHITFGVFLMSQQYVGQHLQCYTTHQGHIGNVEQTCSARLYHFAVEPNLAEKFKNDEVEPTYAFYRISQWIFLTIGKLFFFLTVC